MKWIRISDIVWSDRKSRLPGSVLVVDFTGVSSFSDTEEGEPVWESVEEAYKSTMVAFNTGPKGKSKRSLEKAIQSGLIHKGIDTIYI